MPKIRLFNPFRRSRSKKRRVRRASARRRKSNTGGTLTFMANPHRRRRRHHAKVSRRRRRSNPFRARRARVHVHRRSKRRSRRARNPFAKVRRFRRSRRSNPFGGNLGGKAIQALWAIGGGVLTRSLPQAILGDKNSGIMGYAANAATAFVSSIAAGKFFGPSAGENVLLGGIVMTAGRLIEDFLGQQLVTFANVQIPGLPSLSGDSRYRLAGDFQNFNFPVPYSSLGPASRPALCAPAGVAAGMGSTWGRGGNPWSN